MIRFRPIMMTTACTIMGTLPIVIGVGANADALRSLGLCVVGGLTFAQFVTLYLTPVFYTYMDVFVNGRTGESRVAVESSQAGCSRPTRMTDFLLVNNSADGK